MDRRSQRRASHRKTAPTTDASRPLHRLRPGGRGAPTSELGRVGYRLGANANQPDGAGATTRLIDPQPHPRREAVLGGKRGSSNATPVAKLTGRCSVASMATWTLAPGTRLRRWRTPTAGGGSVGRRGLQFL